MSPPLATQDRTFCGRAAMIAAAIACLLQPTSAFIKGAAVSAGSRHRHHQRGSGQQRATTPTLPPTYHGEAFTATRRTYQHIDGTARNTARRLRRSVLMVTAAPAQAAPAVATAAAAAKAVEEGVLSRVKKPVRSLAEAKRDLLHLFSLSSAGIELTSEQEERAGSLLETLEANYTPIQTIGFFNLAVQGDWHLAYTNSPMKPIGPRFQVSKLYQKIAAGEGAEGSLANVLEWRLLDEGVSGQFEVDCGYRLDPRGRMNVSVLEHRLVPIDKMPQDPQELVRLLQRAMPHEMFDPDAHALDITFMDESVRIVRMRGAKFEGRLNVFARNIALPSPPLLSLESKQGMDREGMGEGKETG